MERTISAKKVESFGTIPMSRFGHTCTVAGKDKLLVFGGAMGDVKNYTMMNDTFMLIMQPSPLTFTWMQLESNLYNNTLRYW